jgi:DNA-binding transcriptional LysR family regulator
VRAHGGVQTTDRGSVLYRYALDILSLADKAQADAGISSKSVAGTVHIGAGETRGFSTLARAMIATRETYPDVTFDVKDGTSADLMDGFVKGYYDFLLECDLRPHEDFNTLELPGEDVWGVVVPSDHPLASQDGVTAQELAAWPVVLSNQGLRRKLGAWAKDVFPDLTIAATYNLALNSRELARANLGVLLCYDGLIDDPELAFVPLVPRLTAKHGVLWRKTMLTKPAQAFLDELQEVCVRG